MRVFTQVAGRIVGGMLFWKSYGALRANAEESMSFLVLLGIIAVVAFYAISIYNGLVTSRNGYKNAFAQIDVQLTRRYDLIPNLVETVKGYMKHERETLEAVIQARNSAVTGLSAAKANPGDPQAMQQLAGAANAQLRLVPVDVVKSQSDDLAGAQSQPRQKQ